MSSVVSRFEDLEVSGGFDADDSSDSAFLNTSRYDEATVDGGSSFA